MSTQHAFTLEEGGTAPEAPANGFHSIRQALELAGVSFASPRQMAASLPFTAGDTTAGSETELQAVVMGAKEAVDLPQIIERSNYFANIMKRAAAGEAPRRLVSDLERFLNDNPSRVWENSWVRFPRRLLSPFAAHLFAADLRADKGNPAAGLRSDAERFSITVAEGEEHLRLPISYLIKLSLADHIGTQGILPPVIRRTGIRLLGHYLNDNTSPETFSFNVVPLSPQTGMGRGIARETAVRFLLTQLLVSYANGQFGLERSGQQAMIYFAPHPPVRQKELNDLVPDAFYRELFMSPCLSGWDRGEEKYRYMQLCHQVLSRSQLNAVAKLREAGIICNNLVVLPNVSSVSLANNGTHVSLGSRLLTGALGNPASGFTPRHEKYLGDLATKVIEHFLPLFVGTYSAAPYRLAYTDFHPERALGFLPHELDYTHLRMLWRRWRKKARLSFFGTPITPFGPQWLDRMASGIFGLKGDCVPDYRLVDYLVCILSTVRSPALDGTPGNADRLRKDLADMGVFDEQMSVYLLYKQREFAKMGFSGFEGRYYSQFESIAEDMGRGVDIQTLVTALAFKYMATGMVSHADIPDDPSVESERRQIFFGAAVGIPTFYVHRTSGNAFLRRLLERTRGIRASRRYPGYLRVTLHEYRRALLRVLAEDGADLVEMMGLGETLRDLSARLDDPDRYSAAGRLTRGILAEVNASSPLAVNAREFNEGAERYYRETLRRRHLAEALRFLEEDFAQIDREPSGEDEAFRKALRFVLQGEQATAYLSRIREELLRGEAPLPELRRLINLVLLTVHRDGGDANS
ncbi:hypothetical protein [Geobacter pickeringii]|uniref:hypothetical protein n=1 Tax=Geobacter pickeringii TaxID=345632 RepID=UPI00068CC105|nr:hypothetical protein [Geobacter pickeringii]